MITVIQFPDPRVWSILSHCWTSNVNDVRFWHQWRGTIDIKPPWKIIRTFFTFSRFLKIKKTWLFTFFELLHTFSRTLATRDAPQHLKIFLSQFCMTVDNDKLWSCRNCRPRLRRSVTKLVKCRRNNSDAHASSITCDGRTVLATLAVSQKGKTHRRPRVWTRQWEKCPYFGGRTLL